MDTVRILLDRGANVNNADKIGRTPLYWATKEDHTEIVNMLKSKDAK